MPEAKERSSVATTAIPANDAKPQRPDPVARKELADLHLRSREARASNADSARLVVTAIENLKGTAGRSRSPEARFQQSMLRAPDLVFRRVQEAAGKPISDFYGLDTEMFGGSRGGAVLDQPDWYARIHPDDLPAYRVAEAERRLSGKAYTMEYRLRHALTGELHRVRETAWAEQDPDTHETLFDSYIVDVTPPKHKDAALRADEARYRRLVEEGSTYICCFGPDHKLTFTNDAFCRRVGRPRAELLGANFMALVAREDAEQWRARLALLSFAQPSVTHEVALDGPDGSRRWEEWTDQATFDAAGKVIEYQSFGRDVTERKNAEERILHLAYHDALTDLPNRALFEDRLRQALARAGRDGNRVALMILDLDDFKLVNDTFGHQVGDRLLCEVGDRLRRTVRDTDTVARFGGDEFVVLLTALGDRSAPATVAGKITRSLAGSFWVDRQPIRTGASLGVAIFPDDATEPDSLLGCADVALYRAKQSGRSGFCLFGSASGAPSPAHIGLERDLRRAIPRTELFLLYQPKFELAHRRCIGFEGLARWRHPHHGTMLPEAFIPTAEAGQLINNLGAWVLEEACRQSAAWRAAGRPNTISVNLSPKQILDPNLLELVTDVLHRTATAPEDLELEITENLVVDFCDPAIVPKLQRVSELGVRLSVDDFGRGCSSLAYLSRLPIHTIKIDRSFIASIGRDPGDEAIIRAMIGLGHSLGRRVLAEGVETKAQLAFLRAEGCDEAQGFYLGPPLLPARAGAYLRG